MRNEDILDLDTRKLLKAFNLKLRIKGLRQWGIRTWIGVRLIQLAAWIMWLDVEIEIEE